jgi:NADH-quinone oxidoreductase subunit M
MVLGAESVGFPVLSTLIVLPIIGSVVCLLVSRSRPELVRQLALLFSGATGAVSVWVLVNFERTDPGFQFVEQHEWVKDLGIGWHLGVDGISLFLVVLTGFLFPLAIISIVPEHDPKPYFAWLLLLQGACMGVFVSLDLFAFFVFFELVLVPMYFLIGEWGHGNRTYAAIKFFVYTMLGSALMLVGILALVFLSSHATGDPITFDLVKLAEGQALSVVTARWVFLAFAVAFAIKVPMFPLHTWLPDAHTEAPTAGSIILAGVMLKMGTYGFLRFGMYLFPEATHYFAPLFLTLGVIGILYGAVVATMQRDLKRLVAYSSIAHLGFIILGTFALTRQALTGSVTQMINHGLSTGALFLLVGMLYERRHTRLISDLSGLQKAAPIMAAAFTLVMLSSIGLPGLNGFVGEFLILVGTFASRRWWAVVAAVGVILAALYLLWAYQRVFHGAPERPENEELADLNLREGLAMLALVGLIVFLGVYPRPMLERIEPSVQALLDHVERTVPGATGAEPPEARSSTDEDLARLAATAQAEADLEGDSGAEGGGPQGGAQAATVPAAAPQEQGTGR